MKQLDQMERITIDNNNESEGNELDAIKKEFAHTVDNSIFSQLTDIISKRKPQIKKQQLRQSIKK